MSTPYGYARMPRIIRKGYKHLTKLQKLLYIYLRDLCGEKGTCYRSLRTLAEETDFSIGYLSDNIPLLAEAGLINAKKQKRNGKKWEVWHITIVDIWEENTKFMQAEKCSPDEQIEEDQQENRSPDEQDNENCSQDEQISPESVHGMNENTEKCSRGANNREKGMTKNPSLNKKESTAPSSNQHVSLFPKLNDEEKDFCRWWCEIKNRKVDALSERDYRDIQTLTPEIRSQEELQAFYEHEYSRLRKYAQSQGREAEPPELFNLVKRLPKWKEMQASKSQDQPQDDWLTSMKARSGVRSGMMEKTARAKKGA